MSFAQFGYQYTPATQLMLHKPPAEMCGTRGDGICTVGGRVPFGPCPIQGPFERGVCVGGLGAFTAAASPAYGAYLSYHGQPPPIYAPLAGYELTDGTRPPLTHASYCTYDPGLSHYPCDRFGAAEANAARRKNATRDATATLKAWLNEHRKNPYPTKGEKIMLAIITRMTLTQISTWFANARRRLKKDNKMTWAPVGSHGRDAMDGADHKEADGDSSHSDQNEDIGDNSQLTDEGDDGKADDRRRICSPATVSDKRSLSSTTMHASSSSSESNHGPTAAHHAPPIPANHHDDDHRSGNSDAARNGGRFDGTSWRRQQPGPKPPPAADKPKFWSLAHTATSPAGEQNRWSPRPGQASGLASGLPYFPAPQQRAGETRVGAAASRSPVDSLRCWVSEAFRGGVSAGELQWGSDRETGPPFWTDGSLRLKLAAEGGPAHGNRGMPAAFVNSEPAPTQGAVGLQV